MCVCVCVCEYIYIYIYMNEEYFLKSILKKIKSAQYWAPDQDES